MVIGHEHPSIFRNELNSIKNVVPLLLVLEIREVESDVTDSEKFVSIAECFLDFSNSLSSNTQKFLAIDRGAGTSCSRLDAEQVVQEFANEVEVQETSSEFDHEGIDRNSIQIHISENHNILHCGKSGINFGDDFSVSLHDILGSKLLLELEDHTSSDGSNDRRSSCMFSLFNI